LTCFTASIAPTAAFTSAAIRSFIGQAGVVNAIFTFTRSSQIAMCSTIPRETRSRPNSGSITCVSLSRIWSCVTDIGSGPFDRGGSVAARAGGGPVTPPSRAG